jgi:hypothetical protein
MALEPKVSLLSASAGFLLGSFFHPEDGDKFLRNIALFPAPRCYNPEACTVQIKKETLLPVSSILGGTR